MSTITITKTPYGGSPVDITNNVILASASFESQVGAVPGSFEFTCRDTAQALSFVTGDEIKLTVDGIALFGGYATQITRTYAFDADDTSVPASYPNRYFIVRGVDYNILFDKRVARNTADYKSWLPEFSATSYDGDLLTTFLDSYIDLPAGFNTSTYVDNIVRPFLASSSATEGRYIQQGDPMRRQFEDFAQFAGAVWYIDASKNFHYHAIENVESRWGFSDIPNNNAITESPASYQGALYGFREMEAIEDGSVIANDALIWGGKPFTGGSQVLFARIQNSASQSEHGRWQIAETHFGEDGFGTQAGVNARGNVIVHGDSGAVGSNRGLRYPQWNLNLAWFAHDVPLLSGSPKHLKPGDLVTTSLEVFGTGGVPLVQTLPLRSIRISFPSGKADTTTYVRFDGSFGLQLDDPKSLWNYILKSQRRSLTITIGTTTNASTSTVFGAIGIFTPSPVPDGSTALFTIPFGYIPGTLQVYRNGMLQRVGSDVFENDPDNGQFLVASPPSGTETLYVVCRTLSS